MNIFEDWHEDHVRRKLGIRRANDILIGDVPRPDPLIIGLIPDKTLTVISSDPHSGKSVLVLEIALCLATETPLFGRYEIPQRRQPLVIGQDAPSWDYAEIFRKLARSKGEKDVPVDFMLNTGLDILSREFASKIEAAHDAVNFNVLIIDTLKSLHNADENSTREMGIVMDTLKSLRDNLRIPILFCHHDVKPTEVTRSAVYKLRGNSVIAGSIDFHLALSRVGGAVTLTMPKGRGAESFDKDNPVRFTLEDGETTEGPTLTLKGTPAPDITGVLKSIVTTRMHRKEIFNQMKSQGHDHPIALMDNSLVALRRQGIVTNDGKHWSPKL